MPFNTTSEHGNYLARLDVLNKLATLRLHGSRTTDPADTKTIADS